MMAERESNKTADGDDEGRKTRARPRRNRSARRELQGNPAKVRARARRILRDDLGQCAEWIRPALVLAVRWNRQRLAQSSAIIADRVRRVEPQQNSARR